MDNKYQPHTRLAKNEEITVPTSTTAKLQYIPGVLGLPYIPELSQETEHLCQDVIATLQVSVLQFILHPHPIKKGYQRKTPNLKMSRSLIQVKALNLSLLFAGLASLLLVYKYAFKPGKPDARSVKILKDLDATLKEDEKEGEEDTKTAASSPAKSNISGGNKSDTPLHSNRSMTTSEGSSSDNIMAELHGQIEEIDKRGKALFKAKKYMDAAEVFTEALDLIHSKVENADKYGNLNRQLVTLMNNRSAMYEKGGVPDLALVGTYHF